MEKDLPHSGDRLVSADAGSILERSVLIQADPTGATLRFMPGASPKRDGRIRHCQGSVLADWTSSAGNGTNLFVLAPDGRIAAVVGFQG